MNTIFSTFEPYLVLYLVTMLVHLALVSFPLGGSVLLCLFEIFRGEEIQPLRSLISRHLAISIGLAITAGVAPLLFLELVHPHAFYNAGTILGGWRPALLVPLIIAFYLAYLQKTELFRRWPGLLRFPVRMVGLASLVAVGLVWSISRRVGEEAAAWHERYLDLPLESLLWDALPGMGLVLATATLGCSIGCLWLIGGDQKRGRLSPGERFLAEETLLRLAIFVAVGLAVVCEILRARHEHPVDLDWWLLRSGLFILITGFVVRLHRIGPGRILATGGALLALATALVIREVRRRGLLVDGGGYDTATMEVAATRGGLVAFIVSFLLCATAIGLALRMIAKAGAPPPAEDEDTIVEEVP